jgi:hypothetical protein
MYTHLAVFRISFLPDVCIRDKRQMRYEPCFCKGAGL